MATELLIPVLGMDMDEATVVEWLVEDGAEVGKGDPVMEIETDKSSFEVEAPAAGVLRREGSFEGETLPTRTRLGWILAKGEEPPDETPTDKPEPEAAEPEPDLAAAEGPEPEPASEPEPVTTAVASPPRASPAARRAAHQAGISLADVTGSGPNGRIYVADVPAEGDGAGDANGNVRTRLSRIRRAGAERTARSAREAPHFHLRRDLDVAELERMQEVCREHLDPAPTLNDLLVALVARVLADHPRLGSRYVGDGELETPDGVHVGVAVATDDGLVVPVVRDPAELRLSTLAATTRDLVARARAGELGLDDIGGARLTISNLGMMGVDAFDAVLNPPEAALLAVGRTRTVPDWQDDTWVPVRRMSATLAVDHRVADGADGARFLADLQDLMSNWERILL